MQKIQNLELLAAFLDNVSSSLRGENEHPISESNALLIDFVAQQLRQKALNEELDMQAVQDSENT
jgi:hypothetical protein